MTPPDAAAGTMQTIRALPTIRIYPLRALLTFAAPANPADSSPPAISFQCEMREKLRRKYAENEVVGRERQVK